MSIFYLGDRSNNDLIEISSNLERSEAQHECLGIRGMSFQFTSKGALWLGALQHINKPFLIVNKSNELEHETMGSI